MDIGKCLHCNSDFKFKKSQQTGKYCSNICQKQKEYLDKIFLWETKNIKPGITTIKQYLKYKQQNKCSICLNSSWCDKNIPLEIDHISGISDDNSIANLRFICPNCHAQTPTYKNKNRGRGRQQRLKRYHQNKTGL